MRPSTIIVIIVWAIVLCVIAALLIVSKLQKNKKSKIANSSYTESSQNTEKKPRPVKAVQPVKETKPAEEVQPVKETKLVEQIQPIPVEKLELEDQEELEEDSFKEEEEPERVVQVVNGRKVFVQFNYSFKAKLILASKEVQQQYRDIINFVRPYGVKTSLSWKQERIYLGRNTYAMILFKGKKLCVAYALDPKEYAESKYHTIDLSEIKRFAKTPALIKISSERKRKYAIELFETIFNKNEFVPKEMTPEHIEIPTRTKEELIDENLIKVYTSDEVTEGTVVEQVSVADIIRKNVTITEAKQLITDESALEYVQVEESSSDNKAYTKKDIINLDVLSKNFAADELVNLELLKEKNLVSKKADFVKVLARGALDKPLIIEAQDFSIDAVKMIVLTGGEVRKVK